MKATMTITSKRQLTIPRKIWDKLQLDGTRYLQAEVQGGKLSLQKADFSSRLDAFWQETADAVHGPITDASIRAASRRGHAQKQLL